MLIENMFALWDTCSKLDYAFQNLCAKYVKQIRNCACIQNKI